MTMNDILSEDTSIQHHCPEPGCTRRFNRKYTLAEHMKTHTGERPHICPLRSCAKSFSTSGNLSRHKRLHGYIEPLPCPVQGCICTFPSNNKLQKHMKFHYGSDVKVCPATGCGKTFSTTGNLNRHVKAMHSEQDMEPKYSGCYASNARSSPVGTDQWTYQQTTPRGYFEPETIWSRGSFTHDRSQYASSGVIYQGNPWNTEVVDALSAFFDEQEAATASPPMDKYNFGVFQSSLQYEFRS
uniref:C2H2-type domain-containing protein n=1 Tax=Globisporangium ultimum (strain ATCC 200006 / CBS 805.95 / DAOM BR144) TaxID=431595 RepID=K3WUX0_GLOUD